MKVIERLKWLVIRGLISLFLSFHILVQPLFANEDDARHVITYDQSHFHYDQRGFENTRQYDYYLRLFDLAYGGELRQYNDLLDSLKLRESNFNPSKDEGGDSSRKTNLRVLEVERANLERLEKAIYSFSKSKFKATLKFPFSTKNSGPSKRQVIRDFDINKFLAYYSPYYQVELELPSGKKAYANFDFVNYLKYELRSQLPSELKRLQRVFGYFKSIAYILAGPGFALLTRSENILNTPLSIILAGLFWWRAGAAFSNDFFLMKEYEAIGVLPSLVDQEIGRASRSDLMEFEAYQLGFDDMVEAAQNKKLRWEVYQNLRRAMLTLRTQITVSDSDTVQAQKEVALLAVVDRFISDMKPRWMKLVGVNDSTFHQFISYRRDVDNLLRDLGWDEAKIQSLHDAPKVALEEMSLTEKIIINNVDKDEWSRFLSEIKKSGLTIKFNNPSVFLIKRLDAIQQNIYEIRFVATITDKEGKSTTESVLLTFQSKESVEKLQKDLEKGIYPSDILGNALEFTTTLEPNGDLPHPNAKAFRSWTQAIKSHCVKSLSTLSGEMQIPEHKARLQSRALDPQAQ